METHMPRVTIDTGALQALPVTAHLVTLDAHLDLMGHMNTMHYWELFSVASRKITSLIGVTAEYVAEERRGAFMLRNFTQFIAETHLGDELTVYTRLIARSEKRFQCMHFMVNSKAANLTATMEVLSTHANLETRRSEAFPLEIVKTLDEMIAEHGNIDWSEAPLCGILAP